MVTDLLQNKKICIYGTGVMADRVSDLLADVGITPECYVVSDGFAENHCYRGKRVIEISDYKNDDEIILVTVSEKSKKDIVSELSNRQLCYYYIDEESFKELYRNLHAFDVNQFLKSPKPVSRVFGYDRGLSIARLYIETFLEGEVSRITDSFGVKTALEVGEDRYMTRFFPDCEHDVLDYCKGMDLTKPESLERDKYDLFICTNVLNCIYDVKAAIKGCYDVLVDGGILLATVPGNICQVSEYDMDRWGDYWRFTYLAIEMLIKEVFGEDIRILTYGNSLAATAFVQGLSVRDISSKSLLLDEVDPSYAIVIGIEARKHIPT